MHVHEGAGPRSHPAKAPVTVQDGPDDLAAVYDEISDLEKSTLQEERYTRYSEYAPWFLAPTVALLALDVILRGTLFRRLSA